MPAAVTLPFLWLRWRLRVVGSLLHGLARLGNLAACPGQNDRESVRENALGVISGYVGKLLFVRIDDETRDRFGEPCHAIGFAAQALAVSFSVTA